MTSVTVDAARIELNEGETVLDGLLREGIEHPHGCKSGVCQSCILQLSEGEVPGVAQQSLTAAQQQLGYFLACQCKPNSDICAVSGTVTAAKVCANILSIEKLNAHVLRLRMEAEMAFKAGQYISVWNPQGQSRCYSIASLSSETGIIELHIKLLPGGVFSEWFDKSLAVGESVEISGPMGECIYTAAPDQPLLLAGIGTGLAPLYGILQDALHAQHKGSITLVVAAKNSSQLYLMNQLRVLEQQVDNLTVHFLVQTLDDNKQDVRVADIYQFIKETHPVTKGYRAFLCGADSFVKKMKKHIFLSGADMKDISADAFLPSG